MVYSELYSFGEARNDVIVVITKMYDDRDGAEHIVIRTEKPLFPETFAEFRLPEHNCYKAFGFSEQEILELDDYLLHNEPIIWDLAREQEESRHAANT
ncbi:MAG: hypothetical protein IJ849_00855 [Selenomonadaceae bacterium]|nr:hypothetical protein [Selenomonadaceae bacterium]